MNLIYFDHNSTTPPFIEAIDEVSRLINLPLNASSIHQFGQKAKGEIEEARFRLAKVLDLGARYKITFTSGATEANNFILKNFANADIFISSIEHPSILKHKDHYNMQIIPVTSNGVIDLMILENMLATSKNDLKLISVMAANNETGIIQPLREISQLAKKYGAFFHSDAVQSIGKMYFKIEDLDIDFISISAHKFGGIIGAGALISKEGFALNPMLLGGGQERSLRSGTENILAIVAMGVAAEINFKNYDDKYNRLLSLRNMLEEKLLNDFPDLLIIGKDISDRLNNTSMIIMPGGVDANMALIAFNLKGIALSNGAACSSGSVKASNTLMAMGLKKSFINSAIRVSLSYRNSVEEINFFTKAFKEICHASLT